MSTTRITLTIGVMPPGRAPIFTSRSMAYTDVTVPIQTLTTVLSTPPFLEFFPVPPEPEPEPDPVLPI